MKDLLDLIVFAFILCHSHWFGVLCGNHDRSRRGPSLGSVDTLGTKGLLTMTTTVVMMVMVIFEATDIKKKYEQMLHQ
jgi:hypothetical protein